MLSNELETNKGRSYLLLQIQFEVVGVEVGLSLRIEPTMMTI